MNRSNLGVRTLLAATSICIFGGVLFAEDFKAAGRSGEAMRPLPVASKTPLPTGGVLFVDAAHGDDHNPGAEQAPWKTLGYSLTRLKPGDTLCLRGGTYYEKISLSQSGSEAHPITIRSYPGEIAVIDGGLREFCEAPAASWEPFPGGADGEFISTRAYPQAAARKAPQQFLPGCWEPMWGLESQRPIALGHFADSMIPLHGYRIAADLRSTNEFWLSSTKDSGMKESAAGDTPTTGIYCGPGLWFDRDTGRVHIRLAHTRLAGLGDRAYSGETDPRKLPLVIALGFGDDVVSITGVRHVRLCDLVFRGATGSPMIHIYGSESIGLDHVTIFGGFPGILIDASKDIHVTNSAIRELAAPWTSRAAMKYRGTATYAIILQNQQPMNDNIEFASCEFTDGHDFAFLRFASHLQFHHNFVDNFNDDGLECGPKLRDHTILIYQNRIGAITSPLTQHENFKDESPIDHDPGTGEFIYRNVIDLRDGIYRFPPDKADPTGAFLHMEGLLCGDHGGPIWPVIRFYQNTVLRRTPIMRDYFLFGLGAMGLPHTERDVFNNIFVQVEQTPGVKFGRLREAQDLREGGNLLWGAKEGAAAADPFAKFRASPLFKQSQAHYPPGWTTDDRLADPKFVKGPVDASPAIDLRLQADSAAVHGGVPLPANWPDPLRGAGPPDIGALPLGAEPWTVGIDGRMSLFGAAPAKN